MQRATFRPSLPAKSTRLPRCVQSDRRIVIPEKSDLFETKRFVLVAREGQQSHRRHQFRARTAPSSRGLSRLHLPVASDPRLARHRPHARRGRPRGRRDCPLRAPSSHRRAGHLDDHGNGRALEHLAGLDSRHLGRTAAKFSFERRSAGRHRGGGGVACRSRLVLPPQP